MVEAERASSSDGSRTRASHDSSSFTVGGSSATQLRFRGQFSEVTPRAALYPRDPVAHSTRMRHVELTYHLGEEGRSGELEIHELGWKQENAGVAILTGELPQRLFRDPGIQGQLFLARQRVLSQRGGSRSARTIVGHDGQPLPFYQHHVAPPTGVRMNAAALLGLRPNAARYEEGLSAGLTNAGTTGLMRKLHWPPLPDEQFLQPAELFPGAVLHVLGKEIEIVDCMDGETRAWLALMGLPTKSAASLAEDPHVAHLRAVAADATAARIAAKHATAENDELRRRERNRFVAKPSLREDRHSTGKKAAPLPSEEQRWQRQRLWAGRVVHFYAVCPVDGPPPQPDRKFTLSYFLADGTVQLLELFPPNSGNEFASQRLQPRNTSAGALRGGGLPGDRSSDQLHQTLSTMAGWAVMGIYLEMAHNMSSWKI
ncbi:hypothetical protein AB1Y20_005291 [Prymnesium parvum]|uniref:DM10 domain-containing protein n=1 Tax=Prymnesium parvum TaxID=97485 RepID=A0AB34J642_PRYPA